MTPRREAQHPAGGGLENVKGGDYVALIVMVTVGIVACALFIAYLLEHRGVLAPGSSPIPTGLDDDLEEPLA